MKNTTKNSKFPNKLMIIKKFVVKNLYKQ